MIPTPPVRPEFRPTLAELPGRAGTAVRATVAAVVAIAVLFAAADVLGGADGGERDVVRAGPLTFNVLVPGALERVEPEAGEVARWERRRAGALVDAFSVAPLELPPFRGDVAGILPVTAARVAGRLAERYPDFDLVEEAKLRLNDVPAYSIVFRTRTPGGERLYGRAALVPDPATGGRRGALLTVLATRRGGVSSPTDVGVQGLVKRIYRSFRFGTEGP